MFSTLSLLMLMLMFECFAEVDAQLKRKHGMCRDTLLRDALRGFSASSEAYLTTRNHFARTLATLSICQYILGIGDRHLSNFMVDTVTFD